MSIVLDCSAAVEALTSASDAGADARRHIATAERITAPNLLDTEVASALFSLARGRRGGEPKLAHPQLHAAISNYKDLTIHRYDVVPLWTRMQALSANLSVYDATYVALAEVLEADLVTADARIHRSGVARCTIHLLK